MVGGLRAIARETGAFENVRGLGSLLAFSFPSSGERDRVLHTLFEQRVLALPCGEDSIRFRLPLIITDADVDELLARTAECARP